MAHMRPIPDKLNICLVDEFFPIVGPTATHGFLWLIAKGLVERGHTVKVLAGKSSLNKPEINKDGVQAYFLHQGGTPYANLPFPEAVYEKFVELHKEEPFHIVHSLDKSAMLIGKNKKIHKVAISYDVEATQMSQLFSILGMAQDTVSSLITTSCSLIYNFLCSYYHYDHKLLSTADGIFAASPLQRLVLERYYLYPDAKIYSIPYGIEMNDLSTKEKSAELRTSLNIPLDSKVVATITDMTELGELRYVLDAFQKVAIKKPSSRMIIVGTGPRWKEVEYHMLMLALGGKVIMTGSVKSQDLTDYIGLADVFMNIGSRTSGFEPSMLAAMAQKKVIVGSEMSPIATIVEDGVDGFLVRPADAHSIANLIIDIIDDRIPIQQIGERARKKITRIFDSNRMVHQTIMAYHNILQATGYYKVPFLHFLHWHKPFNQSLTGK